MLTPFSPFDINCKELNLKNLWKCIFTASRRASFWYFSNVTLNHRGSPLNQYLLEFSWILLQHLVVTSKMELFVRKNGYIIMLMTVVTESFVLNVTGLLDWTLKHIDKCRLRQYQYSIRHLHIQTHQKNTKTKCQIYSKLAINSPERHHVLLLLILNIFCTWLYSYYCWIWTNKCWLGLRNYISRK